MSSSVGLKLQKSLATATKAETAIASYMLANLSSLPFETAATLAEKTGVSAPMIGRFCRSLGYQHFKDLKGDLKEDIGEKPWLIGDRLRDFRKRSRKGEDQLARGLDLEIAGLVQVYEMAHTKEWKRVVRRLAKAPRIVGEARRHEDKKARSYRNSLRISRRCCPPSPSSA